MPSIKKTLKSVQQKLKSAATPAFLRPSTALPRPRSRSRSPTLSVFDEIFKPKPVRADLFTIEILLASPAATIVPTPPPAPAPEPIRYVLGRLPIPAEFRAASKPESTNPPVRQVAPAAAEERASWLAQLKKEGIPATVRAAMQERAQIIREREQKEREEKERKEQEAREIELLEIEVEEARAQLEYWEQVVDASEKREKTLEESIERLDEMVGRLDVIGERLDSLEVRSGCAANACSTSRQPHTSSSLSAILLGAAILFGSGHEDGNILQRFGGSLKDGAGEYHGMGGGKGAGGRESGGVQDLGTRIGEGWEAADEQEGGMHSPKNSRGTCATDISLFVQSAAYSLQTTQARCQCLRAPCLPIHLPAYERMSACDRRRGFLSQQFGGVEKWGRELVGDRKWPTNTGGRIARRFLGAYAQRTSPLLVLLIGTLIADDPGALPMTARASSAYTSSGV
ncbi:hypothetical protein GLOTRDRAFT_94135 [Gloeophyllum trabeum ATCC 11539]|uniref:Uncharacterized protein n=1 Tax=Gloeophyllum trabeum (strain ATCC 11539 / FP-39264 / Madison 617) TaxID=670483 RepID=S7RJZ6_GLOTA|nr:uncharacterized protein GLOTRDRAFT_94135 [Gloeophyllum trabeum ATCC 11539]EPQ54705.1 hypothetical protein GLOTRDRAFT_94135 [Gloeophyllum trabeum ATCC 11539]